MNNENTENTAKETNNKDNKKNFVMYLTDLKNKGISKLFFSRFALIVLLLLIQVFFWLSLFVWLQEYLPYYAVFQIAFVLATSIYLFNSNMDSSAKLTWLMVIAVLPFFGAIFFVFTKSNIGHRKVTKRALKLIECCFK